MRSPLRPRSATRRRTAPIYRSTARRELSPRTRAALTLLDFDHFHIHAPEMIFSLPAGGRRLVQYVDGYEATICAGKVTFENGQPTGERPGRLVRA